MNDAVCDSSSPALTGEQSAHTEEIRQVIVNALSDHQFADDLRALHHRHVRLDANARHFIAQRVLDALGLERVHWTCDECSPCWPHRGGYGRCSCDCHPADPAADLEHALLREALRLACEDGWDDGQWAMRRYIEMAQAHLSGSSGGEG